MEHIKESYYIVEEHVNKSLDIIPLSKNFDLVSNSYERVIIDSQNIEHLNIYIHSNVADISIRNGKKLKSVFVYSDIVLHIDIWSSNIKVVHMHGSGNCWLSLYNTCIELLLPFMNDVRMKSYESEVLLTQKECDYNIDSSLVSFKDDSIIEVIDDKIIKKKFSKSDMKNNMQDLIPYLI